MTMTMTEPWRDAKAVEVQYQLGNLSGGAREQALATVAALEKAEAERDAEHDDRVRWMREYETEVKIAKKAQSKLTAALEQVVRLRMALEKIASVDTRCRCKDCTTCLAHAALANTAPPSDAPPASYDYAQWKARGEHAEHGRGNAEDGPDDPDCPCRGTEKQAACAKSGCGFCRAAPPSDAPASAPCHSCGYDGEEETPCPAREDGTHCVHWWDGPAEMMPSCAAEEAAPPSAPQAVEVPREVVRSVRKHLLSTDHSRGCSFWDVEPCDCGLDRLLALLPAVPEVKR